MDIKKQLKFVVKNWTIYIIAAIQAFYAGIRILPAILVFNFKIFSYPILLGSLLIYVAMILVSVGVLRGKIYGGMEQCVCMLFF